MIIIVEGIDRVGKTTLCNKLHERLNIPIYKHDKSKLDYSDMSNESETLKMLHLLDEYDNIIFDRFHWSDYVYGTIERNYNKKQAVLNLLLIQSKLLLKNARLIYIKPIDLSMSSNQHGKSLVKHNLRMEYCNRVNRLKSYVCTYNNIDEIVEEIANENRI